MAALVRIYAAHPRAARRPAGAGRKLAFWIGLALGVLIKGPIGLMVVALSVIALWIGDRKPADLARRTWAGAGA